jgi:hypothetical protein
VSEKARQTHMASALLSRSLRKLRSTSWTRSTLSRPTCSFFSTDATVTPPKYTIVRHPVSQESITPVDYFAVVKLGGTQYKVTQVYKDIYDRIVIHICIYNDNIGRYSDCREIKRCKSG